MGRLSKRAAFLDRDGTLNVRPSDHAYITSQDDFEWLPGAVEGAARLAAAGYVLAVVSNQRGVALGLMDVTTLYALEAVIERDLAHHGCGIEAFGYCVHGEDEGCSCRKPQPGLILRLARELDVDPRRSWMIGDSSSDVLAGQAAGCQTALIASVPERCEPDLVAPSLAAASELIAGEAATLSPRARPDQPQTLRGGRDTCASDRRAG